MLIHISLDCEKIDLVFTINIFSIQDSLAIKYSVIKRNSYTNIMNNKLCVECNKYIHGFKYNTTLYRCGDANVCSEKCSKTRYDKLELIDPNLVSPISWSEIQNNYIKKTNSVPSFYPDTILKIDDIKYVPIHEEPDEFGIIKKIFIIFNNFIYNVLYNIILFTK